MNTTVEAMVACLSQGDPVFLPSKFWEGLNQKNIRQLETEGFQNFKQTIAQNYFTWVIPYRDPQFLYLLRRTPLSTWPAILRGVLSSDIPSRLTRRQHIELTLFTRMLWALAERTDSEGLLEHIHEPIQGNPFPIQFRGNLISQDLANSALEYYSIREHFKAAKDDSVTLCEIGAGYGRNAYLFLRAFPRSKYIIIDIPPALYIAQQYLTSVFPDRTIAQFRCFDHFSEVQDEYERSDIIFLLPHQARMLPAKSVDLLINISSLHEMTTRQIQEYFNLIDRLGRNLFYSKQWLVSRNPDDGLVITQDDYPVPNHWNQLFKRQARVQTHFFEALYSIER